MIAAYFGNCGCPSIFSYFKIKFSNQSDQIYPVVFFYRSVTTIFRSGLSIIDWFKKIFFLVSSSLLLLILQYVLADLVNKISKSKFLCRRAISLVVRYMRISPHPLLRVSYGAKSSRFDTSSHLLQSRNSGYLWNRIIKRINSHFFYILSEYNLPSLPLPWIKTQWWLLCISIVFFQFFFHFSPRANI